MYPILFRIGNVSIPTYGILGVAAIVACIFMLRHFGRKEGLPPQRAADAVIYTCFAGLAGARLFQLFLVWDEVAANPSQITATALSAGPYLGGVISAIAFGLFWFRYVKIPLLQGLDLLALTGALSMGIARWGCFFSGCCHGNPTDLPWGVTFPAIARELHAGLPAVPIHPTQVYLSLNSLVIFGLLVLLYRRKRFHGQIMMVYLMLYAVTRYFIEFVRGDAVRGFVIEGLLSTSQFISVVAFIAAGTTLYVLSRRHRASGQPDWQPAAANAPIAEPAARSQKRKRRRR